MSFEEQPAVSTPIIEQVAEPVAQLSLFADEPTSAEQKVLKQLQQANLITSTPMEAMNLLYALQQQLKK